MTESWLKDTEERPCNWFLVFGRLSLYQQWFRWVQEELPGELSSKPPGKFRGEEKQETFERSIRKVSKGRQLRRGVGLDSCLPPLKIFKCNSLIYINLMKILHSNPFLCQSEHCTNNIKFDSNLGQGSNSHAFALSAAAFASETWENQIISFLVSFCILLHFSFKGFFWLTCNWVIRIHFWLFWPKLIIGGLFRRFLLIGWDRGLFQLVL